VFYENCLLIGKSQKFQTPNTKFQTNPNDPNSKFQTNDPHTVVPNGIIAGRLWLAKRCDTTGVNVLVIEY
jgi:hypothetical protein